LTYAYNARCAAILNLTRLRLEQHRYKTKVPVLKQTQTHEDDEDNNRKNDIELYSLSSIAGLLSKALETPYVHDLDDIERKFRRTSNKPSYSAVLSPSKAKVPDQDETQHTTIKRIGTKDSKQLICPSLQMIVYNNLGIIKCIQNRLNEALTCFEKALQIFNDSKSDIKTFRNEEGIGHDAYDCFSKSRNSIDSKTDCIHKAPIVPLEYLHLTTLSNLSRLCVRMNDNIRSNQIITDINSTHFTIPSFYHPQYRRPSLINHPPNNNHDIHHYNHLQTRIKWIQSTSQTYIQGLLNQRLEQHQSALEFYNKALYSCRKEVGHNHIYVATILEKKGSVLFDQRKLQTSMLSYLASLKIYDYLYEECNRIEFYSVEKSRILYAVGRTLHDREEYSDALTVYEKALSFHRVKSSTEDKTDDALSDKNSPGKIKSNVDAVTILCNIGRLYHILGDLNNALKANLDIVDLAIEMVGGGETAESHPFVRNRLVILGNLYVEAGMLEEAMEVFARVVRNGDGGSDLLVLSHARPGMEDVDTSAYDARGAVKSSSNMGMSFFSHAAAA
jgi:tetratricopeptide (TPR) repeat protein